jgi:hypothetical protein
VSPAVVCGEALASDLRKAGHEPLVATQTTVEALTGGAVVVLDDLSEAEAVALQGMLADSARASIAVLLRRWDGFEPLPLAASCRGIISGFGIAGVGAAIEQFAGDS